MWTVCLKKKITFTDTILQEYGHACMYEALEDFQLVVFLISCYEFTYQAPRTIIHSVAAKAFFILSPYKCFTYRSLAGRKWFESVIISVQMFAFSTINFGKFSDLYATGNSLICTPRKQALRSPRCCDHGSDIKNSAQRRGSFIEWNFFFCAGRNSHMQKVQTTGTGEWKS